MERSISVQSMPTGIQRIFADTNTANDIDGTDDFRVDVDVAVIDTGVDFQHPDLNVVGGVNCYNAAFWRTTCTSGGDDNHYHGTHVAGTIGAIDNGIGVVGVAPGRASGRSRCLAHLEAVTAHRLWRASIGSQPTRQLSRSPI